eukprot:364410-Chlamydomonas_euryale.AAC.18
MPAKAACCAAAAVHCQRCQRRWLRVHRRGCPVRATAAAPAPRTQQHRHAAAGQTTCPGR